MYLKSSLKISIGLFLCIRFLHKISLISFTLSIHSTVGFRVSLIRG